MEKAILVTGGAGAIGSILASKLSENPDHYVIILDNLSSGHVENIKMCSNIRFVEGCVESDEDLNRVFSWPIHTVYHLAANFANQNSVEFPQRDLQVNGMGTLKLLLYSTQHGVKRFVYSSSSCVYGNRNEPLDERCREFSLDTPYGITKFLGEQYVRFFIQHHQLEGVMLRYFNVFGPNEYPGHYRNVIANFLYLALKNEPIPITGTGDETRDFNYTEDTVRATMLAAENEEAVGKVINIASGRETSIKDLVQMILKVTGSQSKVVYKEKRGWDSVTRRVAAVEVARNILGYRPEVSTEEGLKRYYNWLKKQDLHKCKW